VFALELTFFYFLKLNINKVNSTKIDIEKSYNGESGWWLGHTRKLFGQTRPVPLLVIYRLSVK